MDNQFTKIIADILASHFGALSEDVFEKSQLLQYINLKTKSANKGAKARGSFANLYAIYVIVEDYLAKGYDKKGDYSKYEGAEFAKLFKRQRELPFGAKLQNHALNNRMNSEFQKFFPNTEYPQPIMRDLETNRYWINKNLIELTVGGTPCNIAVAIIEVIDAYAKTKKDAFEQFIHACETLHSVQSKNPKEVEKFIVELLAPNVDARLFEIVSYAILKYYYHDQKIYWGFEIDKLKKESLILYKTGRTNANDGGIDFVMRPLGRFFQVTETLDFKKYFLDIDKIHHYPITFVIKASEDIEFLEKGIRDRALKSYGVKAVVDRYMACVEEIVNIPRLQNCFANAVKAGYLRLVLDEIILQSKIEFNYQENEDQEEA